MSHIGNWSPDKRVRVAADLREQAAAFSPARLTAEGSSAFMICTECRRGVPINLRRLIARGLGHIPLTMWERRCSRCCKTLGRVVIVRAEDWPEQPKPQAVRAG